MAAGLGFKTFTTGEVLTAADTNGYLMQGILVFATEAARNSAITSPQEGQFAFTKDTNSLWYYSGSAWVASGATGDIEGVSAGIGISGGGTSGTVTVTNSMATAIDAKADLIVGTGADAFSRLGVGANNTVLTADSAEATGLKWAAPAGGGGKVLQVVSATTTTATTIASTTLTDTGLTLSITPTLATSKILILITQTGFWQRNESTQAVGMVIQRASTTVYDMNDNGYGVAGFANTGSTSIDAIFTMSASFLDSPATTSATTYKTQARVVSTANSGQVVMQRNRKPSTITLLEIGA